MTIASAQHSLKIQVSALQGFDALVRSLGGDPSVLLAKVGLSSASLALGNQGIATEQMSALLTLTAQELQTPAFGMMLGASQDFVALGDFGKLLQNCQTFLDALQVGNGLMAYHNQGEVWYHQVYGDTCYVFRQDLTRQITHARQFTELAFAVCLHLARLAVGGPLDGFRLEFSHQAMANMSDYQHYLKVPVRFNCQQDALLFPAQYLKTPFIGASHREFDTAMANVNAALAQRQRKLTEQVTALIQQNLSGQAPSLVFVANLMGVQPRTLQRRLAEENVQFKQLLLQVRMTLAKRYLSCSQLDVTVIAQLVGYTELSNFTRAFHAFNGASPLNWRKKVK